MYSRAATHGKRAPAGVIMIEFELDSAISVIPDAPYRIDGWVTNLDSRPN